jgi:hypothetical protein
MSNREYRVAVVKQSGSLEGVIQGAWEQTGLLKRLSASTRIAIKPNFTYLTTNPV